MTLILLKIWKISEIAQFTKNINNNGNKSGLPKSFKSYIQFVYTAYFV